MTQTIDPRLDPNRDIRAPRGNQLNCKNWLIEAAYALRDGREAFRAYYHS
ncbi:hypothetical protein [Serratia entomophila]|nr:hypothetical protein [Serratia entomophila]CAI1565992.1 Uncharacterised protein [Serratia entomophila]CAI1606226.1 Uncharacterised protein [Serratia entomophila]